MAAMWNNTVPRLEVIIHCLPLRDVFIMLSSSSKHQHGDCDGLGARPTIENQHRRYAASTSRSSCAPLTRLLRPMPRLTSEEAAGVHEGLMNSAWVNPVDSACPPGDNSRSNTLQIRHRHGLIIRTSLHGGDIDSPRAGPDMCPLPRSSDLLSTVAEGMKDDVGTGSEFCLPYPVPGPRLRRGQRQPRYISGNDRKGRESLSPLRRQCWVGRQAAGTSRQVSQHGSSPGGRSWSLDDRST